MVTLQGSSSFFTLPMLIENHGQSLDAREGVSNSRAVQRVDEASGVRQHRPMGAGRLSTHTLNTSCPLQLPGWINKGGIFYEVLQGRVERQFILPR